MKQYLDLSSNKDYSKLQFPAEIIKKGGIVIFPTETVYGIGTNGLDKNAIKKFKTWKHYRERNGFVAVEWGGTEIK